MTRQTTIDSYRVLRISACFGIVILHSLFACEVYFKGSLTQGQILYSGLFEHLLMWCVPCFLLITGALLLDPEREVPLSKLFGKYMRRMVLALVVFTFIFRALDVMAGEKDGLVSGFFRDLFFGESGAHMWYLYLMIGIYFMMPVYRAASEKLSDKTMQYIIAVLVVFTSVLPALESFGLPLAFYIPTSLVYPAYIFLGYYIHNHKMDRALALLLLVGCTAVLVLLSFLRAGGVSYAEGLDQLFGYSSPLILGQSCGVFGLFDRMDVKNLPAFWQSADRCTFGIYLIHMIFIHWMFKWAGVDPYTIGAWIFPAAAVLFFLVSFAITWCIRKIPKANLL